jgi:hypothetical protein
VAVELRTEFDGRYDRVRVPEFRTWSLVWTET